MGKKKQHIKNYSFFLFRTNFKFPIFNIISLLFSLRIQQPNKSVPILYLLLPNLPPTNPSLSVPLSAHLFRAKKKKIKQQFLRKHLYAKTEKKRKKTRKKAKKEKTNLKLSIAMNWGCSTWFWAVDTGNCWIQINEAFHTSANKAIMGTNTLWGMWIASRKSRRTAVIDYWRKGKLKDTVQNTTVKFQIYFPFRFIFLFFLFKKKRGLCV